MIRFLLVVLAGVVVLVAGMMSATLLDFGPGAWAALGGLLLSVVTRGLAWLGVLPDAFDFDAD